MFVPKRNGTQAMSKMPHIFHTQKLSTESQKLQITRPQRSSFTAPLVVELARQNKLWKTLGLRTSKMRAATMISRIAIKGRQCICEYSRCRPGKLDQFSGEVRS
ncbi:UNVERIFIED_CONTAM: hypothetical protein GTU68_049271 [Idotea baltica]|nr:hypothetical protein [Idotea baltica]